MTIPDLIGEVCWTESNIPPYTQRHALIPNVMLPHLHN